MISEPTSVMAMKHEPGYERFELSLLRSLGATIGGAGLSHALGYPSPDAFRKAYQRGLIPITTFEIDGRKGRFAAVTDIAAWLWTQKRSECALGKENGGAS